MATRKGYRKSVRIALDLQEYIANNSHAQYPVCGYVSERRIAGVTDIDHICRIAKIMGRNVAKHGGVWYESGKKVGDVEL